MAPITVNRAVNNLAKLGRLQTYVGLMFTSVIVAILLVIAGNLFFGKDTTVPTKATVTKADCPSEQKWVAPTSKKPGYYKTVYKCTMTVAYEVNGKKYEVPLYQETSRPYTVNTILSGRVDTLAPSTFMMHTLSKDQMSYIVSGISVVMILIMVMVWIYTRSQIGSAAIGAKSVWSIFT